MRVKALYALLVICFIGFALPTLADDKADAAAFVTNVGKEALSVITDKSKNKEEKNAKLEEMFVQYVDIDWIGKFVVGRFWKTATDQQKTQYMSNYRTFLINHYTSNFAEFNNANFEVTRVIPDESGGHTVTMHIKRPQAEDVVVDYNIRRNDKKELKVYDISVEGVSMITTQRSDFTSVITQNGFDYLIQQLAKRSTTTANNG